MSFQREVYEDVDQYHLNHYDEPINYDDNTLNQGSEGLHEHVAPDLSDGQVAALRNGRFSESRGYNRPQYGRQYTERDVYTQPSTMQRSQQAYDPSITTVTGVDPHTASWNQRVNNPIFINSVASVVHRLLNRQVVESELEQLRTYVLSVNPRPFGGMSDKNIIPSIAKGFVQRLHGAHAEPYFMDVHEMLKYEIKETGETDQARLINDRINEKMRKIDPRIPHVHIGSIMGHQSPYDILNLFNPEALLEYHHVEFDSKYRIADATLDNRKYSWSILYDNQRHKGTVNIVGSKVRDLVGFEIYPMRIPVPAISSPALHKQFRLFIHQFATQAFASPSNRPYHCVFRPTTDGLFLDLDPVGDKDQGGSFSFDKKVTRFDELSISFTDPTEDVVFAPDRFEATITAYATPTVITTPTAHGILVGDVVTFEGFTTTDTVLDRDVIMAFNSQSFVVAAVTATTMDIPIDTSSIPVLRQVPGLRVVVYPESRRFFMYMKIKYHVPEESYP